MSIEFVIALLTALVSAGAVPLFLRSLKEFKDEFRHSYIALCLGMVIFGLAQLQLPLVQAFELEFWVTSGAVAVPFLASAVLIFLSMRRFSRLVRISTRWTSPLWVVSTMLVLTALLVVAPHVATELPAVVFIATNALNLWIAIIVFFAAMTVAYIRSVIANRYRTALTWMLASFGVYVLAALHFVFVALWIPANSWYAGAVWISYTFILISTILFWCAGYAFKRINRRQPAATGSPIEVISYVASLVSNPREIDEYLDTLRQVTAQLASPGLKLTAAQEESLATLYKKLEVYLTTKEPLQHFTPQSLRETIATRFQFDQTGSSVFWRLFQQKAINSGS